MRSALILLHQRVRIGLPGEELAMKRLSLIATVGALLLCISGVAQAELDPLRGVKEALLRAEVMIVIDSSGSMSSGVCTTCTGQCDTVSGGDCLGDRAGDVDLAGDGLCTGAERPSTHPSDCTLTENADPLSGTAAAAGQAPSCGPNNVVSRFAMVKRALRSLLPELRTAANFGLVNFEQTGYYTYYQATTALPSKPVSVFLTEWEMKKLGAWDTTNDRPASSFVWPSTSGSGASMTLTSASSLAVTADSLYRSATDSAVEKRFGWSTAGRRYSSSAQDWTYVGSYYTYDQSAIDVSLATQVEATYQGPQFTDTLGATWVYKRYKQTICEYNEQGMGGVQDSVLVQPLTDSTAQADHDIAIGSILAHLNAAPNGGFVAVGYTPLGPSIGVAQQHFDDRANGTGPFTAADSAAACRKRFVLVLSDGSSAEGVDPVSAATALLSADPSNPIKTYVIGLPGADMALLNTIAAAGGTGAALYADDEQVLIDTLEDTLFGELTGSYATTGAGVATSGDSPIQDNIALLPATDYPGWQGQLRAVDLTTKCAGPTPPANVACSTGTCVGGRCQLWDAGAQLETRDWKSRRLYTGLHTTNSGNPIPLIASDTSGTPCVSASAATGCSTAIGVETIWTAVTGVAAPADLGAMLQWLQGKDRSWRLPAILRSVPASVGPPPYLPSVPGHDALEAAQATRQRLVYISSTEGLLHAFDQQHGSEVFAYLPAHLLPRAYELYKQGGQDADPAKFIWVSASSPRVEDLEVVDGTGSANWRTHLVQTAGPGAEDFVVLDITDPSYCSDPNDSTTCTINAPPVRVIHDSRVASPSLDTSFGQTWSVPALFWTTGESPRAAFASGYEMSIPGEGNYYTLYKSIATSGWDTDSASIESHLLDDTGAQVNDYAVVADTVAVADFTGPRHVIATYQADLNGRITRFPQGETSMTTVLLDSTDAAGPGHPFYFSPAALYREDLNKVALAAASGAFQEADTSWNPSFESNLYLRAEDGGSVDPTVDNVTCAISQICGGACFSVPTGCTAPSARALPVASPLLLRNRLAADQLEAFYLYYDPPAAACDGNAVARGDSWLIRVASDPFGTSQSLVESRRLAGKQVMGLSLVGGGSDVVLMRSGRGGERASIETLSGSPVTAVGVAGLPIVEGWREVR
jgi:hypothetical protein